MSDKKPKERGTSAATAPGPLSMRFPGKGKGMRRGDGDGETAQSPNLFPKPGPLQPHGPALSAFRRALVAGDRTSALLQWGSVTAAERAEYVKFSDLNADLALMVSVLGFSTLPIMRSMAVTFADRPGLVQKVMQAEQGHWATMIARDSALWQSFIDWMPKHVTLGDQHARDWGKLLQIGASKQRAKKMFEAVYSPLLETPYSKELVVVPWREHAISRLYKTLSENVPLAQARMANDYSLVVEYQGKPPDFGGLWDKDGNHVVIAAKLVSADPSAKKGRKKFKQAALHEIGHAVGDEDGGHDWAKNYSFVNWKLNMSRDEWSKAMWDDDKQLDDKTRATTKRAPEVPSQTARLIVTSWILGGNAVPDFDIPGGVDPAGYKRDQQAMFSYIESHYAKQKLVRYWQVLKQHSAETMYKVEPTKLNVIDNRAYMRLEDHHGQLVSYRHAAWEQRVSTYSFKSYKEWFAENYEHYHRRNDGGRPLEAGTRKKLDELNAKAEKAGAGTTELKADATHRLPFPW